MFLMSQPKFEKSVNYKTTRVVQYALRRLVATAKSLPAVRWVGKDPTQEAVMNAIWLWVDKEMSAAALERALATYLPKLETILEQEAKLKEDQKRAAVAEAASVREQGDQEMTASKEAELRRRTAARKKPGGPKGTGPGRPDHEEQPKAGRGKTQG